MSLFIVLDFWISMLHYSEQFSCSITLVVFIHITDEYLAKTSLCPYLVKAAIVNPTILQ